MNDAGDPPRWLEGADPPSDAVRELLAAAPRIPTLPAAVRAQSAAHVARLVAAGSTSGLWFLGRHWSRGGLLGGTGAVGAASALIAALVISHPWAPAPSGGASHAVTAPRLPAPLPAPPVTTPPAVTAPVVVTAPTVEPPSAVRAHARARAASPPASLEEEHAMLSRSHQALARGAPREALALVRAHAHAYPHGQFNQEREYLTIRALAALGQHRQVRARAAAFVARYPEGIYIRDVRALLENSP